MIKNFIIDNFFFIVKLFIYSGVALFIFALAKKEKNKKINNEMIQNNTKTGINIETNNEKTSKDTGMLMGFGLVGVVIGIVLFILAIAAVIFVIYIMIKVGPLFNALE